MAGASILCATDLTEHSHRVVDLGVAAAKAFGARLDLVHVVDDADSWWPESPELEEVTELAREHTTRYEAGLEAQLQEEQKRCVAAGVECEAFVVRGRPWRLIPEVAQERSSFLIVIGPYGSGGKRAVDRSGVTERVLGSTAERVIRAADRPVFVSTGEEAIPDGLAGTRWLVGTDFSESSLAAVSWAKRAVARVGGELHVANVVIPAGGEEKPDEERTWRQVLRDQSKLEAGKKLDDYITQHAPEAQPHQVVSPEYPSHALCDAAVMVEADVLVVGTQHHSVLGRLLLGSTASRCLRIAPMPVLMVPERAR
ncbi:MAG: universal stress protein [Deltaproteobacteria bacterium]|nr:universal stress protein [Deltaproteobacteria bacterium]